MKRRLRKKLRIGEFRENAFVVSATLTRGLTDGSRERFFDEFMDFVTDHGLQFGGLCDPIWDGVIELRGRGTALDSHRELVNDWLQDHRLVDSVQVGRLFDVWNGESPRRGSQPAE